MGYIGNQSTKIVYTNLDRFKGALVDITALNAITGMSSGDMYKLIDSNHAYMYDGSVWVDMGDIEGPQGPKGIGISSIIRTDGDGSEGTTDTYTITYDDTSTSTFNVTNGTSGTINHIAKTDTVGTTDTYTAYADATKTQPLGSFEVYNGIDGRAITTVTFTSTTDASGLPAQSGGTDTYTISYSDATTSTYNIYNGADVTNISILDDNSITATNMWSSSKINTELGNKQDTLVSGANIKTINGESVLGSGDIVINSGGAVDSVAGKTGVVTLVKGDVGLNNVDNTSDINKPISTATQTALNSKVDKVAGKQLSTEDYTTVEKTKLSGLSNYTKPASEPISYITGLQTALDSKVSKTGVEALHSTDALRISGTTLSLYKGDGTFESVVTQDTIYTLPTATSTVKGGIEIFSDTVQTTAANAVSTTASRTYGIQLNSAGQAVVNVPWSDTNTVYTLPTASATVLGGIKVGTNLSIDANGVLSANDTNVSFSEISNKPTSISGYGITDAYTKTQVNSLIPDISTKQDTLVSGTNIKTINGQSVLGSGNLIITGGGAVDLGEYYKKTETYSKVEVDTLIGDIASALDTINGEVI